jgi:glc operon protein GlcG
MYQSEKISYTDALTLITTVIAEAEKLQKNVSTAVSGPEGELIAFARMDGAPATSAVIAPNKAYTAARDRQETANMGAYMRSTNTPPSFWGDEKITGFGGGVPIMKNGKVIGGIGVSGLSEEEDIALAKAAFGALGDA